MSTATPDPELKELIQALTDKINGTAPAAPSAVEKGAQLFRDRHAGALAYGAKKAAEREANPPATRSIKAGQDLFDSTQKKGSKK